MGLKSLKPYHTFLLLVERAELLHSLSPDASPALWRLLHVEESHLTPFFTLAADADLTLTQVFMVNLWQGMTKVFIFVAIYVSLVFRIELSLVP